MCQGIEQISAATNLDAAQVPSFLGGGFDWDVDWLPQSKRRIGREVLRPPRRVVADADNAPAVELGAASPLLTSPATPLVGRRGAAHSKDTQALSEDDRQMRGIQRRIIQVTRGRPRAREPRVPHLAPPHGCSFPWCSASCSWVPHLPSASLQAVQRATAATVRMLVRRVPGVTERSWPHVNRFGRGRPWTDPDCEPPGPLACRVLDTRRGAAEPAWAPFWRSCREDLRTYMS